MAQGSPKLLYLKTEANKRKAENLKSQTPGPSAHMGSPSFTDKELHYRFERIIDALADFNERLTTSEKTLLRLITLLKKSL